MSEPSNTSQQRQRAYRVGRERFANPPGSPEHGRRRHRVIKFLWRQRLHAKKIHVPRSHLLPTEQVLAGLETHRARGLESVTWLGHAAFFLRFGGRNILIDPFLSEYASPLQGVGPRRFVPPALSVGQLPPIDTLLVSHNHYDHLDRLTIEALPGKRHIEVAVPLGLGRFFKRRGFRRVTELGWHDSQMAGGLKIICVPAIHRSARSLVDRNRTLWAGFVLDDGVRRIYFGGDTGYGAIFKESGRRYGPFDLAILGIGCYAPRAAMRMNHADPEEAVQIALDLDASHVMGMHWGAIRMTEEPPFEPPRRFRAAAAAKGFKPSQAWLMRVGETRELPIGAVAAKGSRAA